MLFFFFFHYLSNPSVNKHCKNAFFPPLLIEPFSTRAAQARVFPSSQEFTASRLLPAAAHPPRGLQLRPAATSGRAPAAAAGHRLRAPSAAAGQQGRSPTRRGRAPSPPRPAAGSRGLASGAARLPRGRPQPQPRAPHLGGSRRGAGSPRRAARWGRAGPGGLAASCPAAAAASPRRR